MSHEVKDFKKDVLDRSQQIPVLVDFWADWCAPCKTLGPILEKLAKKHEGQWALVKVNVDLMPDIAGAFGIQSIPSVKLVFKGKVVSEFVGAQPEQAIEQWLSKAVPDTGQGQLAKAKALLANGDVKSAGKILDGIVKAEPNNEEARALLATTHIYTDAKKAMEIVKDIQEGSKFYDRAEGIRLMTKLIDANGLPDGPGKAGYTRAIEALRALDFEKALAGFIDVIRVDRQYNEDGARKACVAIFKSLGEENELTKRYRPIFSSALYI